MSTQQVSQASQFLQTLFPEKPEIGIILGSGLGALSEKVENRMEISYQSIPHFPISTVQGHRGKLVLGRLSGKIVAMMVGRFHHYEGYTLQQITFPIQVMSQLGIHTLIVTNAAGAIRKSFQPGELMVIEDHINLMGSNPLIGIYQKEWDTRFPDMTTAYTPSLKRLAQKIAQQHKIPLQKGVYVAVTGPSFETPSEIRMMRILGADAVGMSTVPEVIMARQMGLKILGISCLTNMAAGILNQPLTHEETCEIAKKSQKDFITLLTEIIRAIEL